MEEQSLLLIYLFSLWKRRVREDCCWFLLLSVYKVPYKRISAKKLIIPEIYIIYV